MRITHRVSIRSTARVRQELTAIGVLVPPDGLVTFEIDEDHEAWGQLKSRLSEWDAVDAVSTTFTRKEVEEAAFCELFPTWHRGYPQPKEDDFGFLEATYDLTEFCSVCGVGLKQRAPFQMRGEPKWGRNGILQLNWIFDEFFVTPAVWREVFASKGVGQRVVTDTKGRELESVVQLDVRGSIPIKASDLPASACATCGRRKYLPVARGPFPALASDPGGHIVRTREFFGSGASAHNRILVSRELAEAISASGLRGAGLRPVASS